MTNHASKVHCDMQKKYVGTTCVNKAHCDKTCKQTKRIVSRSALTAEQVVHASYLVIDFYELIRNSSGNTRPQSSHLAEPLWTDHGLKSGISLPELVST